jgi:glutamyl-tRNA reductase
MHIGILGISHKSADLPLREKLAQVCERLFGKTHYVYPYFSHVLLSTCNRTEIYFHSEDLAATHTYLLNTIRSHITEEFEHKVYTYFGVDCFFHLARVTAGIDSALIGETEIQGQVKRAYANASEHRSLDSALHFLFQKCLKIGKDSRSNPFFAQRALSIEEAVVHAASNKWIDLTTKRFLFVGLSNVNYKILKHLQKSGLAQISLCNRTAHKGETLKEQGKFHLLAWEKLHTWHHFDIIIFGTKCPHFLIHAGQLPEITSPKLIIDLSLPRNVDPQVGRGKITLLNVDQIQNGDRKRRLKAVEVARIETERIAQVVQAQVSLFKLRELQKAATLLDNSFSFGN